MEFHFSALPRRGMIGLFMTFTAVLVRYYSIFEEY
jgi:hypothetical protein